MKNPFKKSLRDDSLKVAYATGFLTPKSIILGAIKDRLAGTGISFITLIFPVDSDTGYNIMVKNESGETLSFTLEKSDITMIKKLFIKRIINKWNENFDIEPKSIIIQINTIKESIEVFINDFKEIVHKFDLNKS